MENKYRALEVKEKGVTAMLLERSSENEESDSPELPMTSRSMGYIGGKSQDIELI